MNDDYIKGSAVSVVTYFLFRFCQANQSSCDAANVEELQGRCRMADTNKMRRNDTTVVNYPIGGPDYHDALILDGGRKSIHLLQDMSNDVHAGFEAIHIT